MIKLRFAAVVTFLVSAQFSLYSQTSPRPPNTADRIDPTATNFAQPAYQPITESQRIAEFAKGLANPLYLVGNAASAGMGQWRDTPKEWKQGARGFGLRMGSSWGEHVVNQSLLFGASSLFHEDNRYVRSGQTGTGGRIAYALGSTFVARGDDGHRHLSRSRLLALAGAAAISRLWQPRSTAGVRSAATNFGVGVGATMGFQVIREFWPQK